MGVWENQKYSRPELVKDGLNKTTTKRVANSSKIVVVLNIGFG